MHDANASVRHFTVSVLGHRRQAMGRRQGIKAMTTAMRYDRIDKYLRCGRKYAALQQADAKYNWIADKLANGDGDKRACPYLGTTPERGSKAH
jgi:hypothetical protein